MKNSSLVDKVHITDPITKCQREDNITDDVSVSKGLKQSQSPVGRLVGDGVGADEL